MNNDTPYVFHDGKLGFQIKYLIGGELAHNDSLKLITKRSINWRMNSKTSPEKRLRYPAYNSPSLVEFRSLSREWKDIITATFGNPPEVISKSWFSEQYIYDQKAYDFYCDHTYGDDNSTHLSTDLRQQYAYNASVLNTAIKIKANRKTYVKTIGAKNVDMWQAISNDVNAFTEVPHNLPTTRDSLRRKINQYVKGGYVSLISGKLTNKNASKVKEDQQFALIDSLISKHTNLDNVQISEIYNEVAKINNWDTITSSTIANRKTESNLITYAARNGASQLSNNLLVQNKRYKPSGSMAYWTLDGWDAELLYQKTSTNNKGHNVTSYHNRLTMVVVLDTVTDYPVGYAIGTHETPQLIKQALKNAVLHVNEILGELYIPYQLQSDNYAKKALEELYNNCSQVYTPAKVKNAKSKVIEPYFNYLNKKFCRLFPNWSGFNISSGSKNKPNDEFLQKIKHTFPDAEGCYNQLVSVINKDRANKQKAYINYFINSEKQDYKKYLSKERFLDVFGETTGKTNKLRGDGIRLVLNKEEHYFDCFDINFRKNAHIDWILKYDPDNMDEVLAVNHDRTKQFLLEKKFVQPMALIDRKEGDAEELQKVSDFNKNAIAMITEQQAKNYDLIAPLLEQPELKDTLAKMVLTDSLGQHKNQKSANRLKASENAGVIIEKTKRKSAKKQEKSFQQMREEYVNSKVNLQDYL